LSLAASSLASEERDVVLRGVSLSAEQGHARATATSPPGRSPQNESGLITRIFLDKGTKSILVIWTWTRRTLRSNKVLLLESWSRLQVNLRDRVLEHRLFAGRTASGTGIKGCSRVKVSTASHVATIRVRV
jgi:hypothetical protein